MKNSKLFQYVVIGSFIFFIIVGVILFATFRSSNRGNTDVSITIWGTLPSDSFSSFTSKYFTEYDLKYKIDYIEKSPATFDQDLVEALASQVGPDAIILPTDLLIRYQDRIYTIPYTSLSELVFKNTFVQEAELYLNQNGALALPFTVDPLVMYWNQDIFNNVGVTNPPSTWAEVSALVPKMTRKDQNQNILASTVSLGEFRNIVNAKEILSALFIQAGNPIVSVSKDGTFKSVLSEDSGFEESPAVLSLEFFTNFSNPNKKEYSWNRSLVNSLDSFTNGDLAIYFGFASEFLRIREKNPNLNFNVTFLPQVVQTKVYSTYGNMLGFAIMRASTDPAGTYQVLTSLVSREAFPFWKDIFNIPSARRDILAQGETSAVKTIFNQSAIISKGWLDPHKIKTGAIFQDMVESYTTGRESLTSSVSTASDRLDNLLNN